MLLFSLFRPLIKYAKPTQLWNVWLSKVSNQNRAAFFVCRRRWVLVFLVFIFCVRKLFDDLSPTPRSSPRNRKSVRTNSPETKSNKKGLEAQQNKIDEKGQSIIRNIALKNWSTVVNASLHHDLFAPEFKDVLAREVAKEC